MLIDTHCHINNMIKTTFDIPLSEDDCKKAQKIITESYAYDVTAFLNVGTSLIESKNSILLARTYNQIYASIGIHPNDCTPTWNDDIQELRKLLQEDAHKIVAIGECGLDYHYEPHYKQRQKDAFRAHIELALEHNLALVIHTRDADDEVLKILHEYRSPTLRGTIHCFSETLSFAHEAIKLGFFIGLGGTITYPKNDHLRETIITIGITHCILETDAPFLPPQNMRGKPNHPYNINTVAHYLAQLLNEPYQDIATVTTNNAIHLFNLPLTP